MARDDRGGKLLRALGEFSIIVVGVLVALAADSWLTDREDAERSRAAIALLIADLETDSIRMAQVAGGAPPHDTVSATMFSTAPEAALTADSVVLLFRRLSIGSDFVASRSAYESLSQTDGIRHIGSPELQSQIVHYYRELQADVANWYGMWGVRYDRYLQLMGRHLAPAVGSFEDGMVSWTAIPIEVTTSWAEIRGDSELMSQIWGMGAYEQNLNLMIRDAQVANQDLRRSLAEVR